MSLSSLGREHNLSLQVITLLFARSPPRKR
ncbi:hypothetical protein PO663_08445 [Enterobacter roggenkampii]